LKPKEKISTISKETLENSAYSASIGLEPEKCVLAQVEGVKRTVADFKKKNIS